jgi:SET domain-containing protein
MKISETVQIGIIHLRREKQRKRKSDCKSADTVIPQFLLPCSKSLRVSRKQAQPPISPKNYFNYVIIPTMNFADTPISLLENIPFSPRRFPIFITMSTSNELAVSAAS